MTTGEVLGHRIRVLAAVKRLSQRALARATGISLNTINSLYNGKLDERLAFRTLERLADGLGVHVSDLVAQDTKGIYQDLRFNQFTSSLGPCYSATTDHLPAPPHVAHARAQAA